MRDRTRLVRGELRRWRGLRSTRHIGRQLLILYALTVVAITTVFSVTLLYSSVSSAEQLAALGKRDQLREDGLRLRALQAEANALLLLHLSDGSERSLTAYRAASARRRAALDAIGNAAGTGPQRDEVTALRRGLDAYDAAAERAIGQRRGAPAETTLAGWLADGAARHEEALAGLDAFVDAQRAASSAATVPVPPGIGVIVLLAGTFIAALLGLWIIRRIILSITTPLETLAGAAAAIGAGRLETRVAPGLSAEFDMLGSVMNGMAARLAESREELQGALAATERRNHELRTIGEVGAALESSLDLPAILDRSLGVVLAAFASQAAGEGAPDDNVPDAAVILLTGEGGDAHYWRPRDGATLADSARDAAARALRAATAEPVLAGGRSLVLGGDPARGTLPGALRDAGYRAAAIVPLKAAVRARGALALLARADWRPSDRDLALLEQVGGQIARAAENALLYVAEKQRGAEAGILAQMAQLMSGTLDLDRLARLIARYAVRVLGADRCIVGFYDRGHGQPDPPGAAGGDALRQIYQYGFPQQQLALVEGGRESLQRIVRRYMADGRTLVVPDVEADERAEVRALAREIGARSLIGVPLIARERQVGLIYLDTREPRRHAFGPSDQRILTAIADQAAAALEGARLYEAERRRAEQLRVLNEVGRQIAAAPDLGALFAGVAALIRDTFGYEHVALGLIERGDDGATEDALVFVAGAGAGWAAADEQEEPPSLPLAGPGLTTWAAREGRVCSVPDVSLDERYVALDTPDTRAELVVPIRTKEGVIGVLDARSARVAAFDEDAERVLASVADQLAIAIENSRLHERALALAVVDERNRLARELHDSVTQALFSMHLTVEAARLLLRRDVDAAERQLAHLGERTKEALAEMRALIHSLRPAAMAEPGLAPALRRWVERVRREDLLPVELVVEGTPRLREREEQELFRIVQEALNNAVKHAAATRVRVHLLARADGVTLTIEDDGKGFDPAQAVRPDAFGLLGMRERAASLGARLAIDSSPGGGTRVRVTLPRGTARLLAAAPGPPERPLMMGLRTSDE